MDFDYSVNYTLKSRISVSISSANRITVNCPLGCPVSVIEEFLERKSSWINGVLKKNAVKLSENEDVLSFEKIYVEGKKVPLIMNGGKYGIFDDGVYIGDFVKIEYLYKDKFTQPFLEKVQKIADRCKIKYGYAKIDDYVSIWGCCNARGYICFNYKVFMLSPKLQEYVIIHELCHFKHMDHSKEFWALVEKFMPDYREAKKQLKKFDFITRLY